MPNLRIPRRNSPHRIAAIALYRALLTQCRAVPLAEEQREELLNIVRNRFKQAQHSNSPRLLKVSFEAGYEAIDHLDAAVAGNEESKVYISSLLERAPTKIKQAPAPKSGTKEAPQDGGKPHKPKTSIFDRPLPLEKLSGKRHVPVLFNANGFPVLRIKKPQPENLSGYIQKRIDQRQKWHERRYRLYEELNVAAREDEWDKLIATQSTTSAGEGEPAWRLAVDGAINHVHGKLSEMKEKARVMAEKMQAVVDREQEVFDQEKKDRKEAKRKEKQQKRLLKSVSATQVPGVGSETGDVESIEQTG